MSRFSRLKVLNTFTELGLLPLFYNPDPEVAFQIASACHRGGAKAIEFTNRGDFAHEVFADLSKRVRQAFPEMMLGVGSIQDIGTAALYIQLGADFVVMPVLREDVVLMCNRRKIAVIPGVSTPTEIGRAEELGVEIVKIAPGDVLGPAFLKAHLAPCPWTLSMISGGVSPDADNLKQWFAAGATCVGMGSKLVSAELVKAGNFQKIEETVRFCLKTIEELRN
jgi:2-dehydro-3-deoxyphosphogluconate aldolase / (4S)-4-hydroxy-2-oxoglutarate aldolase